MAVCWGEGHGSAIHDHANSHCFMKMLRGSLQEIRFDWPKNEGDQLKEIGRKILRENEVAYINGKKKHVINTQNLYMYFDQSPLKGFIISTRRVCNVYYKEFVDQKICNYY